MKFKRPKRTLDDDLRDLVIESKGLVKQIEQLYANHMTERFGDLPVQNLTCDSCEEEGE
jgi:hypothetical protein